MPKSRRDRKITLAKTQKKHGLETKQALVDKLRAAVDAHARCFVFSVDNMRNNHLKDLRETWGAHSKFFLGKNRVMALALGKSEADEYAENLHKVAGLLHNQCGLLFTNETRKKVVEYFSSHEEPDFLRTGSTAQETVELLGGPLEQFPHSMEPQLRALGMPTALKKGVVHLGGDVYTVCKKGDVLSSEQARILRLLGEQQAKFRLNMLAMWNKIDGKVELLRSLNGKSGDEGDDASE